MGSRSPLWLTRRYRKLQLSTQYRAHCIGMAYLIPLIHPGMAAFRIYQNYSGDEKRKPDSAKMRDQGLLERMAIGGSTSQLAKMSDKQFEKFVKTNSVGKRNADDLSA